MKLLNLSHKQTTEQKPYDNLLRFRKAFDKIQCLFMIKKNPEENRNIMGISQHNEGNRQEAHRQFDPKQRKLKAFL